VGQVAAGQPCHASHLARLPIPATTICTHVGGNWFGEKLTEKLRLMRVLLFIFILGLTKTFAHPSVSIIMDSKGNVYYSDLTQVWKIDTQGKKQVIVRNVHTHELFIDKNENLYGEHLWYESETDTWKHYVWRLSVDNKLEKIIPDTKAFQKDFSFVQDRNENMYLPDDLGTCQKIIKKQSNGVQTKLGDECLTKIKWMTCTPDGIVYVIDNNDLKKIDKQGHVSLVVDKLSEKKQDGSTSYLSGPNIDMNGNVYISDCDAGQVKKISVDKKISVFAKTNSPWFPSGSLLAPNGDFWILECSQTNEVRVERIAKDGRRIVY
jgi:hypothetical protein